MMSMAVMTMVLVVPMATVMFLRQLLLAQMRLNLPTQILRVTFMFAGG